MIVNNNPSKPRPELPPFRDMLDSRRTRSGVHGPSSPKNGDNPRFLYHYKSMRWGLKQLKSGQLRLARASEYQKGDPFDSNPSTTHPLYRKRMVEEGLEEVLAIEEGFDEHLKKKETEKLRLSCMSDGYRYHRMWMEHAGDFTGICIEYLYMDLYDYKIGFHKVEYSDVNTWDEHGSMDLRGNTSRTTMIKPKQYEWEHEYRHCHTLSYPLDPPGYGDEYMFLPRPTCVYIGYRAEGKERDEVIEFCKSQGIDFRTVELEDTIEKWVGRFSISSAPLGVDGLETVLILGI